MLHYLQYKKYSDQVEAYNGAQAQHGKKGDQKIPNIANNFGEQANYVSYHESSIL